MSIAYGGIIAFLFRGLNAVVAFATVVLVERTSDFGAFGLGIIVVGIVNAAGNGMTAAAAYQVANQGQAPGKTLLSGLLPMSTVSVLGIFAGLVAGSALSGDVAAAAVPVAVAGAALVLNGVITGVFLGRGAFIRYNVALVAPPFLSLCAIAFTVFVLDQRTGEAALGAYAVGQWLALGAALLYGQRLFEGSLRFSLPLSGTMVRFALSASLSGVVSFLGYRGDQFVVAGFEGKAGVETYLLAVVVAESVWQVSGSLSLATYTRIGAASREEAALLTTRVMRHTLLLLAVVCTGLFLVADLIERWVFSSAAMATPLRVLLPGVLIYSLGASLSAFYTYQRGLPWVAAFIAAMALAINIALAFVFIPGLGVEGAALAKSVGYAVAIAAGLVMFVRQERVPVSQLFRFGRDDVEDYRVLLQRLRDLLRTPARTAPLP
ncbi:MAG: polysaccharide biosynthesis C-terminal domain-containing protein [Dehalococcoidia bacterium]|nr:polysaccharide biosynthesis C-terminal domain-containing protein [Dehalococcoidia bacterium]